MSLRSSGRDLGGRVSLVLYLAALALLPWGSFPPFPWLHENAQWSDVLVVAAALARVVELRHSRNWIRPSLPEVLLGAYVAAATASYLVSDPAAASSLGDLAGVAGLALLAVLTADFASDAQAFPLIVRVVTATSLLTAAAAALGLALFYLGVDTSLVGSYGALVASGDYARIKAGFGHASLLGSYCIFASAVVAQGGNAIPERMRRATQIALALTVLSTVSRAIIGFALAVLIRNARTPQLRTVAVAASAICIGVMALLTFTRVSFEPTRPFDTEFSTATDSVREQELKASVDTLRENPALGTGPGSLPGEAIGYGPRQAHNTPVGVAATLGLPAFGALVALFVALWWRRSRPTNLATWGGLAGLAIDGLGQDIEHFRHVWVMIGLAGSTPGTGSRYRRAPLGGDRFSPDQGPDQGHPPR